MVSWHIPCLGVGVKFKVILESWASVVLVNLVHSDNTLNYRVGQAYRNTFIIEWLSYRKNNAEENN